MIFLWYITSDVAILLQRDSKVIVRPHIEHTRWLSPWPALAGQFLSLLLTTNDKRTFHTILAACHQLVQSVLKIGFKYTSKKDEIEGGGRVKAQSVLHTVAVARLNLKISQ